MALEFLGEILAQVVGEVLVYVTGKVILPVLTLGMVRSARFSEDGNLQRTHWHWRDGNTIVLSENATLAVGALFWVGVILAAYAVYHRG